MRRAARVDANQPAIVQALRAAWATVTPTHTVGQGFPDLVVGFRGRTVLLEVKLPHAGLTDDEAQWHAQWRGEAYIVHDVDEALRALGAIE